MKVLMLGKYPTNTISGGVAVHTVNIIKYLGKINRQKIELHMVSFGKESTTFCDGNARITIIKDYKIYYLLPFLAILKIAWEVQKIKPEVIHVQGSNVSPYSLYTLLATRTIKKVITLHSYQTRELIAHGKLKPKSLKYFVFSWFEKNIILKSDLIIAVDSRLKEWVIEECGENLAKKVVVMLNGVDLDTFKPAKKSVIQQNSNCTAEFTIFHAKAFVAKNGQQYLINAMPKIIQNIPDAKLVLAGDGPMKNELLDSINKLEISSSVVLLGNIPNSSVAHFISQSNVVCIPSIHIEGLEEASSIFLVEAMAMEKACVATNIGGLAESIDNKVNGILVPDKSSDAIADAIIELYNNPDLAQKISNNGRKYVEKERNWEAISKRLVELYDQLFIS